MKTIRMIASKGAFWSATEASDGERSNAVLVEGPASFGVRYVEGRLDGSVMTVPRFVVVDCRNNIIGEYAEEKNAELVRDAFRQYFAAPSPEARDGR